MKKLIYILTIVLLASCTKEYSAEVAKKDTTYQIVIHAGKNK